jgi:hypothetical protein
MINIIVLWQTMHTQAAPDHLAGVTQTATVMATFGRGAGAAETRASGGRRTPRIEAGEATTGSGDHCFDSEM